MLKDEITKSDIIEELIKNSIFGNIYKNDYFWTIDENGKKEVLRVKDFDLEVKSEVFYQEIVVDEIPKPKEPVTETSPNDEATVPQLQDNIETAANPPSENQNAVKTKLVEDEKRQVLVKIRSIQKDQSLKMVDYSRGLKDYDLNPQLQIIVLQTP